MLLKCSAFLLTHFLDRKNHILYTVMIDASADGLTKRQDHTLTTAACQLNIFNLTQTFGYITQGLLGCYTALPKSLQIEKYEHSENHTIYMSF